MPLLLELKDPLFLQEKYARKLVTVLREGGVLRSSALVSFHFEHVRAIKAVCPEIPIGHITIKNPFPKPGVQLLGPIWPLLYLNPAYTWLTHRMGSIVAPLDPSPSPRLRYYMALQVDAVLADEPGRVLHDNAPDSARLVSCNMLVRVEHEQASSAARICVPNFVPLRFLVVG